MTTYRIRPLVWEGEVTKEEGSRIRASTTFGSYTVERKWDGNGLQWGYCFDEYYDEDDADCDSVEEGKAACESHWHDRLKQCLDPVTGEQA